MPFLRQLPAMDYGTFKGWCLLWIMEPLKACAMCFNAGCIKQCFLLNPEKILAQIRLDVLERNAKTA